MQKNAAPVAGQTTGYTFFRASVAFEKQITLIAPALNQLLVNTAGWNSDPEDQDCIQHICCKKEHSSEIAQQRAHLICKRQHLTGTHRLKQRWDFMQHEIPSR